MTVPPYVAACFFCISGGWLADRLQTRGLFMIGFFCTALIGLIMLISSDKAGVKYAGCFFFACGIYPNVPQGVAWNGNNIGGSLKRGVGIAMHVGFGNLGTFRRSLIHGPFANGFQGGAIAGFIYLPKDGPHYRQGHGILIGMITMSVCLSTFMTLYLRRENKRRDAAHKAPELYTQEEQLAERTKGDNATFYRYTV